MTNITWDGSLQGARHSRACHQPSCVGVVLCNRYFYISIMYNVCYTLALYGLMLFWIGASELLQVGQAPGSRAESAACAAPAQQLVLPAVSLHRCCNRSRRYHADHHKT